MSYFLRDAIKNCVATSLDKSSNKIIRIDVKSRWPIAQALDDLFLENNKITFGLLDIGRKDEFKNLTCITESHLLTKLRNKQMQERNSLILIGSATALGQAGFKSVSQLITQQKICVVWKKQTLAFVESNYQEREKLIRSTLVSNLIDLVSEGKLTGQSVDEYFQSIFSDSSKETRYIHEFLWLIGIVPDENLLSSNSYLSRIAFNESKIDELKNDYEKMGPKTKKLLKSEDEKVKSFARWLSTRDDFDLQNSELNAILRALQNDSSTTTVSQKQDLFSILKNKHIENRSSILKNVQLEVDDLNLNEIDDLVLDVDDEIEIRIRVKGSTIVSSEWNGFATNLVQVGTAPESSFPVSVVSIKTESNNLVSNPNSETFYRNALLPHLQAQTVIDFFESRSRLIQNIDLMSSQDVDTLLLFISSPKILQFASEYVESWKKLLRDFLNLPGGEVKENLGVILGVMDGHWYRNLDPSESPDAPTIGKSNRFFKVEFLPTHPWRIEPIVQLASQILDRYEFEPNVIDTALWSLDRSIPIFKVLQIAESTLNFSTTLDGKMLFDAIPSNALPPISSFGGLLKRTFGTYVKTHPWATSGTTISIINAPSGGVLKKLTDDLHSTFKHDPAIFLIRDRYTKGTEHEDEFPGIVISQDVENTEDWLVANDLSRDLTFYFIAGMNGQSVELGQGGYGSIDIVLSNSGFDNQGRPISIPQIRLAPDESNETISLLRRVGGSSEIKASTYDLVLPEDVKRVIPLAANNTAWLVVAAPSAISAFSVKDREGKELQQIAEFDEGIYRFFVFASNVEPLAETVRERIKSLPIATSRLNELEKLINGLTKTLPQKVFDIALNSFGPEEALGLMTARALAQRDIPKEDLVVEISLDNVSWTQQWFEKEKKRADLILVAISSDLNSKQPIRIMVIEAKATTKDFVEPRIDAEPLGEAVEQVEITRELLNSLFGKGEKGLIESLQLRTLIEQIATKAAAKYSISKLDDRDIVFRTYFKHISDLGNQKNSFIPPILGMAVATFLDGVQATKLRTEGDLTLISASSRLLEQVLKNQEIDAPEIINSTGQASQNLINILVESNFVKKEKEDYHGNIEKIVDEESENKVNSEMQKEDNSNQVVGDLYKALAYRSEHIGPVTNAETLLGPTFITVNFPFEKGESLAPLQRAESDIARDLGVSTINIDNLKNEAGRIRVLVPRKDRQFPKLPSKSEYEHLSNQYLNLKIGLDLSGTEFDSPISSWPHALIAGSTGSGKTTFIRSILTQLNGWGPNYSNLIIVDGKGETDYFGVLDDQMFAKEYSEPQLNIDQALNVLDWLRDYEVPRRKQQVLKLAKLKSSRVDAKSLFIEAIGKNEEPLIKPLIVVIDEFNELMIRGGNDKSRFVDSVTSIAQAARSVLVHLVLATQRPDRNVLPGVIKANLQARFAFRLLSPADSVIVLNHGGAEKLLNHGDMLVQLNGQADERLQSYWVD